MNNYKSVTAAARKQAVSIRMSRSDVRHIKRLAARLGASDSELIRFAIKSMLTRLAPLQDPSVRGRALVPLFIEPGADLVRHFELDSVRLAEIINDGVEQDRRVDADDIQMIAVNAIGRSAMTLAPSPVGDDPARAAAEELLSVSAKRHTKLDSRDELSPQQYLVQKYLFAKSPSLARNQGGGT